MRIVTNPGSNLSEASADSLDVDVLAQRIVVDGIPHDTRSTVDFDSVDKWVQRARTHPSVSGTTSADFVTAFSTLAKRDPEILAVMTSRKIIGSHDAAVEAAKQLKTSADAAARSARIEIVDTQMTDTGAGLLTLAAVQSRAAGRSLTETATFLRAMASKAVTLVAPATLENLIKGGRASFLAGWVANFFNVRPLIAFDDGALKAVGRMSSKANVADRFHEHFLAAFPTPPKHLWLTVSHGNCEEKAKTIADRLQERLKAEFVYVRPLSTSIYLHMGPGAVFAGVCPLDGLPFMPSPPTIRS